MYVNRGVFGKTQGRRVKFIGQDMRKMPLSQFLFADYTALVVDSAGHVSKGYRGKRVNSERGSILCQS